MGGNSERHPRLAALSRWSASPAGRYVAATLIAVLALALRWPQMTESIWYDEYCRTRLHLNAQSVGWILSHDVHNPLYNAFMYGWTAIFGDSEVSIRTPSLLAGLASIAALAWWAARRFGDAIGWSVAAALASSPVHVWYSGEAKNTMFVIASSVFALIAVDRLGRGPGRWRWPVAVLASLAALWTDFVTALAVGPAFVAAIVTAARSRDSGPDGPSRRRLLGTASAALAVLALTAPLVVFKAINLADAWRDYLRPMTAHEAWRLLCGKLMLGDAILPGGHSRNYIAMGLTVPVALAVVGGWRALRRDRAGMAVLATFALPIPLVWIASEALQAWKPGPERYIYQLRNLVVMLGPYLVVLCAGVWTLRERWMRVATVAALVTAGTTGSVLMQTLYRDRNTVMQPNPDWRAVAGTLAGAGFGPVRHQNVPIDPAPREQPPRPRVVLISKSPVHPLRYYLGGSRVVWLNASTPGLASITDVSTAEAGARLLYVDNLDWAPLSPAERGVILETLRMVEVAARGPIRVYELLPSF